VPVQPVLYHPRQFALKAAKSVPKLIIVENSQIHTTGSARAFTVLQNLI
jgi:hypothetical protein